MISWPRNLRFESNGVELSHVGEQKMRIRPTLRFADAEVSGFDKLMQGVRPGEKREATAKISVEASKVELRGELVTIFSKSTTCNGCVPLRAEPGVSGPTGYLIRIRFAAGNPRIHRAASHVRMLATWQVLKDYRLGRLGPARTFRQTPGRKRPAAAKSSKCNRRALPTSSIFTPGRTSSCSTNCR